MAISFGLNLAPDKDAKQPQRPRAKLTGLLGDDDDEDDNTNPSSQPQDRRAGTTGKTNRSTVLSATGQTASKNASLSTKPASKYNSDEKFNDLSSDRAAQKHITAATTLDAAIYDYDAYHDAQSSVTAAKKSVAARDAADRKPKYMDKLLDAAARRKQDQLVAREKHLQHERQLEGDEFADKEKFVTGAYKAQQEEAHRVDLLEAQKAEAEAGRRKALGTSGLQTSYKGIIDEGEKRHAEAMETAAMLESGTLPTPVPDADGGVKSDLQIADEMRAKGVSVDVNDEGRITDKRQLLSAGLNVAPKPKNVNLPHASNRDSHPTGQRSSGPGRKDDSSARERQTRMVQEQLEASHKRAAERDDQERLALEKAAKSRKTDAEVGSARERYLARKAEKAAEAAAATKTRTASLQCRPPRS